MPLAGFICPIDQGEVPFEFCIKSCSRRCHPLPVLAALYNDRPPVPGVYHVTEIFNPPKVTYLSRHEHYYVEPESNAYTAFGQGYHAVMEAGAAKLKEFGVEDTALLEQSFSAEITTPHGKAVLTGRADRYEPDTKTLWDYKTEKLYSVKKYLANEWDGVKHVYQLNTYRTYMFPEAAHLRLSCAIKDHSYRAKVKDGIRAIVNVEMPILDSSFIRELVTAKVGELLLNEKDPSTIRDCQDEELWNNRIRCEEYCPVNGYCLQYLTYQGKGSGAHDNRKKGKTPGRNQV